MLVLVASLPHDGEIDAGPRKVRDVTGAAPLPRAARSGLTAEQLLDAMPDATAIIDTDGLIVAVNSTWRVFGEDNGAAPDATGIGANYLQVCDRAAGARSEEAREVAAALRAVLRGETVDSFIEYPCPSPAVARWFAVRATLIPGPPRGALVSHVNITRQKVAELDLERRASQDSLTGLVNRSRLTQRLEAALTPRRGRPTVADVGVLFLDLDGFKPVNDTFGHAAGDEVLQAVAQRLRSTVRPQDTVGRLGGDEFAIVAPRITAEGLDGLAGRIERVLAVPHTVHSRPVEVVASIGACLALPGETAEHALQRADQAMYVAKRERALRP